MRQSKSLVAHTLAVVVAAAAVSACGSASYVRSELSGTAKPAGGVSESVPATKSYGATPQAVRAAVLAVLADLGFIADAQPGGLSIRTELKQLPQTESMLVQYSARAFITLSESSVTYRARFDKKSSFVQAETNIEFPEKENELRKQFFDALDVKLPSTPTPSSNPPASPPVQPSAAPEPPKRTEPVAPAVQAQRPPEPMSIADMQRRLQSLGYRPGPPDGKLGSRTVDALKKFQSANQLPVTGKLDTDTESKLRAQSN